jgi:hypothetical protein
MTNELPATPSLLGAAELEAKPSLDVTPLTGSALDADEMVEPAVSSSAPMDRAAVLREAADRLGELRLAEREWLVACGLDKAEQELRRLADEAPCGCGHPVDEHSVYGCADGCACELMPKRPPMDPVHILGIGVPADAEQQPEAAEGAQQ